MKFYNFFKKIKENDFYNFELSRFCGFNPSYNIPNVMPKIIQNMLIVNILIILNPFSLSIGTVVYCIRLFYCL